MHNIHVSVSYLVYKLVLIPHLFSIAIPQYKCTDCHCSMDNVVSRGILCMYHYFLRLYYVRTAKNVHNNYTKKQKKHC